MTVRSILDTKGHDILSLEPDSKLSAAVKMLSERRIGAVLVIAFASARTRLVLRVEMMPTIAISMMIPTVTCTPWKPVSVKKLELNRLVVKPTPSW